MSRISFENTRKRLPERKDTWDMLAAWDEKRDQSEPIIFLGMVRTLTDEISPGALVAAVTELANDGAVEKVYQIVDPATASLLPAVYRSRDEISATTDPDRVRLVLIPHPNGAQASA